MLLHIVGGDLQGVDEASVMERWGVGHNGDDTDPPGWLQGELPSIARLWSGQVRGVSLVKPLSPARLKRQPSPARGRRLTVNAQLPRTQQPRALTLRQATSRQTAPRPQATGLP